MNSCEKATVLCNKYQYKEASLIDKLKLKMHLIMCKGCAKHSKKNGKLTALCDKLKVENCLSENEKQEMKQNLESQN